MASGTSMEPLHGASPTVPRSEENLSSVNAIVSSYSGDSCELWAQLGVKYQVPPVEAVHLLSKTWPG